MSSHTFPIFSWMPIKNYVDLFLVIILVSYRLTLTHDEFLSITSKGFIFYYCMVLSVIKQYGQNPAFLLVALAHKTHSPFVSLPTVAPPQMYFLAFGNSRGVCSSVFGCYIIAWFCMLLFVLSYIRSTLQDKVTLRHLSKQLTFRFTFLLRAGFFFFRFRFVLCPFLDIL